MKLYNTDYVLVTLDTKKPIEGYNIINHYTSVIDEFNLQLSKNNVQYIPMTSLTKKEQNKYIERNKKNAISI